MHLTPNRVFHTTMPLDLGYVYGLEGHIPDSSRAKLLFEPFEPQPSPMVDPARPMLEQVEDHDILLFYPYESMSPLLNLLREASGDDDCISIKITLYRVAKQSHLCESLIQAAEEGKDVTVLMELRARFDEENNIAWAERLQEAGCTVIYGAEGFKCHSKICQITYHDANGVSRITCLGTGNFNEKTARLYSDFMLMTAHPGIAADGNVFFRNLSLGNLKGSYNYLGVAPYGLKPLVMGGLDREIERVRAGLPAQVFMKMN
jgi:polyphosphate kinase